MDNKKLIPIIIVVLTLVVGAGFWYWSKKKATPTTPTKTTTTPTTSVNPTQASVTQEASKSIGATIFEKTQDPLKTKLPETNPLKRVIKNPFE